ncbi:hypothetical protein [Phenylobacterium sp.]|uniref:hypothetical protein n=1 Tax=Phenylobacterium sp. TaxID=1871053 RepID=UPI00286C313C|nr:hypothetical protein [Phenylobacterium sp.]
MLATLVQAFTSRLAGPIGFALALVLCALLAVTANTAARTEATLRARVAQLSEENQKSGAVLQARLAACEGGARGGSGGGGVAVRVAGAETSAEARARRLTGSGPPGFDVCARMESADRAVLETLR